MCTCTDYPFDMHGLYYLNTLPRTPYVCMHVTCVYACMHVCLFVVLSVCLFVCMFVCLCTGAGLGFDVGSGAVTGGGVFVGAQECCSALMHFCESHETFAHTCVLMSTCT